MPHQFAATLKRRPVSLGVATGVGAAPNPAREQALESIRAADLEALRGLAIDAGVFFHPAATAERMRSTLIKRLKD